MIYTKLNVSGIEITDNRSINIIKSTGEGNASSNFLAQLNNLNGVNAGSWAIGDDVEIYAEKDTNPPTTKIFKGILESISYPSKPNNEMIILKGRDYTSRLMERTVEPEVYTSLKAGSIVKDILNKYVDDITDTNVSSGIQIDRITFNQTKVFDAIKQLADLTDFNFYIDTDQDLHFSPKLSTSSNKTFGSGNVTSVNFREDRDKIFNEIWVYGDRYLDGYQETFTGDGVTSGFTLTYKPHNTIINVGSDITQPGGIYGMTTHLSGVKYLVNYNGKEIVFVSGTNFGDNIPPNGSGIQVDYKRLLPIVKVGRNVSSISLYGKRVKSISDRNIKDPETAETILSTELNKWALPEKEGTLEIKGVVDITPSQTCVVHLPNQNVSNQIYEILEAKYNFNKFNNQAEKVLTLKVNKKAKDIADPLKDLINEMKRTQASDMSDSDHLTRLEYTTGSQGIRVSGCIVRIRGLGSSFILGGNSTGSLGTDDTVRLGCLGSATGSLSFLGDSRSGLRVIWSGGFF